MRKKPALIFLFTTSILLASCNSDLFYEDICNYDCNENAIVEDDDVEDDDTEEDTEEEWEEDFDDDTEGEEEEEEIEDDNTDCNNTCIHSGFFIKSVKKHKVHAYIGWKDSDNKHVRKNVTFDSKGIYHPDSEVCYSLHAYSSSKSKKENWSKMSKKSREKWCKKLKCADYKSMHCCGKFYPMKHKWNVCVCDVN